MEQQPRFERERAALRLGLFALLLLSPLPFGSVQPWAVLTLEVFAACLGAGALWVVFRDPGALPKRARLLLIPASVLVLVGVLQLLPAAAAWVRLLANPTAQAREAVAGVLPEVSISPSPESLSPPDTLDALLRLIAYILVGFAALVSIRNRRHLKQAALVIAASGAFQALYGSAEYISGHQHIFGYAKKYYLDSATGTFINRNHYASYLALCLPFSLALFLEPRAARERARGWREQILSLAEPGSLRLVLGLLTCFLMWAGLFFSYSRGGLGAAVFGTLVFVVLARAGRRAFRVLAAALFVPLAVVMLWSDLRVPGERFLSHRVQLATLGNRLPIWKEAIQIVPDYPILGTGYGTFELALRLRQPPEVSARWDHVHNDWLQVLTEGGILAFLAVGGLVFVFFHQARRAFRERKFGDLYLTCSVAAIAAIGLHAFMDFPLRIPAIAVLLPLLPALHNRGGY